MGAKGLLLKALKKAPGGIEQDTLTATVVASLVKAGKKERKAQKVVAAKLLLPCFTRRGTLVSIAAPADAEAESSSKKRKSEASPSGATSEAAQAKKAKKKAAVSAPAAAEGDGGGGASLGKVRMLDASTAAAFRAEHRIEVTGEGAAQFLPVATFADAGFSPTVLRACAAFQKPTPIQSECWPVLMAGRDVVGVAETGSGKTLGFFLPAMMHLASSSERRSAGPRVLILAPTRELAMQTEVVCRSAGAEGGLQSICIYGGVPKPPQIKAIRDGATVVVATPGRLLDLQQEGSVDLGGVSYLVLDEADRMLDMGFEKDVRAIIELTRPGAERRTAMFTATWPETVRELASEFLSRPVRVNVGSQELAANTRVAQTVEVIDADRKPARLLQLLAKYHASRQNRVLVFALYKKEAARVEQDIVRAGYKGIAIHGDMTQAARSHALQQFKDGTIPLLVATDVAARGLDIPDVEAVINYAFPLTIEDYIHRIGRTGRGGKTGLSHTLFTNFDKPNAGALQNVLREAGQEVPDALLRFGSAVKKKEHKVPPPSPAPPPAPPSSRARPSRLDHGERPAHTAVLTPGGRPALLGGAPATPHAHVRSPIAPSRSHPVAWQMYGAFSGGAAPMKSATKIVFD